jgi:Kdo2-lipid IVA lauroyltransferase/acyltransferase
VKKLRYFVEVQAIRLMAWLMQTLPRHLVLSLCRMVGTLAWLVDYRGHRDAAENMRIAFNGSKSWWECQRLVRQAYQNFARTFADLFWCGTVTPEQWTQHFVMNVQNPAALEANRKRGVIWVTPHYGNFELASLVWGFTGRCITIVAQDFKNPQLTAIFSAARAATGHRIIAQDGAMLRLIKTLAKGGNVALLTDLSMKPSKAATVIRSFGRLISVTKLHVVLARRLGLIIQPAVCRPLADGRYEVVTFEPIEVRSDESDEAATQRVWDVFETEIRQHPQWWMWMYKHWRYRPREPHGIEYPTYANESSHFEKLLADR